MKTWRQAVVMAAGAMLVCVPLAFAQATDAEFKCEQKATQASTKFVASKSKCVSKCLTNFWKGVGSSADCFPPYGGTTAQCIDDTVLDLKGAEDKFRDAIRKSCDPTLKSTLDCPECYSGGDCSAAGYAGDYVQTIEGQVDSFVPGVACEIGGDAGEQKCMTNTAKALSKQVGGVVKCYLKCFANARKGLISAATCLPPAADPVTAACIAKVDGKTIIAVNKLCGDAGQIPDCSGTDDYPDGATWVNLVDIAISGNIPNNFCE